MIRTETQTNRLIDGGGKVRAIATYISANSFKLSGDWSHAGKGTKLELNNNGTIHYGYVRTQSFSSGETTFTGYFADSSGNEASLTNAAITDVYLGNVCVLRDHPCLIEYPITWLNTTGGTEPAIGNGTLTGKFGVNGKLVYSEMYMRPGSTTTFGDQPFYKWSLPFPGSISELGCIGNAAARDNSVGAFWDGSAMETSSDEYILVLGNKRVGRVNLWTWDTNDYISSRQNYKLI